VKKSIVLFTAIIIFGLLAGCSGGSEEQAAPPVKAAEEAEIKSAADSSNAFAFDLYAALQAQEDAKGKNIFVSPYSVHTALAMTFAGARGNTEAEMKKVLHLGENDMKLHSGIGGLTQEFNEAGKKDFKLGVANALWGAKNRKFLAEFLELNRQCYGAGFQTIDFTNVLAAVATINSWVEKQTQDKIKDLLTKDDIQPDTALVLTNAIYFKGQWKEEFKKDATRDAKFFAAGGKEVAIKMMNRTGKYGYSEDAKVQVVELPYKGDRLSMVVILPVAKDGLAEVEKGLTQKALDAWLGSLRVEEVELGLPRFTMTERYQMGNVLVGMGMPDAFDEMKADFKGMTGQPDLFIYKVIHKAFVDVNEEGTEAAAATAVVMLPKSMPMINRFYADHPFIFLIRDKKTGTVLFLGRLSTPVVQ